MDRKSLSTSRNKFFPQKNRFSLISVTVSTSRKKDYVRENGFLGKENFVQKYVCTRRKIAFISSSIQKMKNTNFQ